jgi:LysM repeat protein
MAVISSNGSAFLVNEPEKLDFDSVPEYVREPRSSRDSYVSKACYVDDELEPHAKSAEIETLWPGISADFLHGNTHQKQPSFYWGIGFISGIVASVLCVGVVCGASKLFVQHSDQQAPQIVIANGKGGVNQVKGALTTVKGAAVVTTRFTNSSDPDVISPIYSTYTVKPGDTLASIAVQAYKRATPRLLDSICRANGMRNANVLSLGQTINLPQYRPQARQIASGVGSMIQ